MEKEKMPMPVDKSHRILSPRIAYIVTTIDENGIINATSFSNITSVSTEPEKLVLSVYKEWDTIQNTKKTKEFVVNVPSKDLLQKVWICGDKYAGHPIPPQINELKIAELTEIPSEKVKSPRIEECYAHLECKVEWIKDVGNHYLILGEIIAASFTKDYFDEDFIVKTAKATPLMEIARGHFSYPEKIIEANRKEAKEKVNKALKEMNLKVPGKIKEYEKLKFSEE